MNAMLMEKNAAIQREYDLDDKDDKAMYDEFLNEQGEIKIGYLSFDPSRILEELDPVAYRTGFNDFIDGLPERWECPECGSINEYESEAINCCQEDRWTCEKCHSDYDNEEEANECCKPEEKENE